MLEALIKILNTPYLWQSLGFVTALSMFISPVLYNGDYKAATKTITIVFGYALFVGLLEYFVLHVSESNGPEVWFQPISLLLFVGLAYIIGLYLGVYIHNRVFYKQDGHI